MSSILSENDFSPKLFLWNCQCKCHGKERGTGGKVEIKLVITVSQVVKGVIVIHTHKVEGGNVQKEWNSLQNTK